MCKCKILLSINDNSLTRYLYKEYVKDNYKHIYQTAHLNIQDLELNEEKKAHKKKTQIF